MTTRRFGVTNAAGTAVIDTDSGQRTITKASLGNRAMVGLMRKGPINKLFLAGTEQEYNFRGGGGFVSGSQLPEAALDCYRESNGRGQTGFVRIADGTQRKAEYEFCNRLNPCGPAMKVSAGNEGTWAGRKRTLVDEYAAVTPNTLQLTTVPANLETNELAGALVSLEAVPGKSFKVVSNTDAGLLVFSLDTNLVAEIGAETGTVIAVRLANDGNAVGIRIKEGTVNPDEEFNLEVWFNEGNIVKRVKNFENLSVDPASASYYERIINDDSDKDYTITVEDLQVGLSLSAARRPANLAAEVVALTDTTAKIKISDEVAVSPVENATGVLADIVPGSLLIRDEYTLEVTILGTRGDATFTQSGQPVADDTVDLGTTTLTWKVAPALPGEIEIGATAEESLDNLRLYINDPANAVYKEVFAEKDSPTVLHVYENTAGALSIAGYAIAASSAAITASGAALAVGTATTLTLVSKEMPLVAGQVVTTDVAYVPSGPFAEYLAGFKFADTTRRSVNDWAVGDKLVVQMRPMEVDALVGGEFAPNQTLFRTKFQIVSNSSDTVTVRDGSTMTDNAAVGNVGLASYVQELEGGHDGLAGVVDQDYLDAYNTNTSPLKSLRGKNLGLVKLATPGVTSVPVQKAGRAYAESQNYQYRVEIPSNIVSESAAEEFVLNTMGRSDYGKYTFPSYAYTLNKNGAGEILQTMTGAIMGEEALIAANNQGYHKAGAGAEAVLGLITRLQDELSERELDEETLNPKGVPVIKKVDGNFVIWGDRLPFANSDAKFAHKREYLSHFENIFLENFLFINFQLNTISRREPLKTTFITLFQPEFAKEAIVAEAGSGFTTGPNPALGIKIDEENNPASFRKDGGLAARIQLNVVDTVERFEITVSQAGITETVL